MTRRENAEIQKTCRQEQRWKHLLWTWSFPSVSQVWATWAGAGMWLWGVMTAPRLFCLSPNLHPCICCAFPKDLSCSCFLFLLVNYLNNSSQNWKLCSEQKHRKSLKEDVFCEDRLRKLGWFTLEKSYRIFQCLKGAYKRAERGFLG